MRSNDVPHPESVDTRVIYDRNSDEIVHIHQAVAEIGARLPAERELTVAALKVASELVGRSIKQLEILSVSEAELKPMVQYKVDVKAKRLVVKETGVDTAKSVPRRKAQEPH